jgi:hypothetical protein
VQVVRQKRQQVGGAGGEPAGMGGRPENHSRLSYPAAWAGGVARCRNVGRAS